ncbi:hypothetical protein AUCHE_05_00270 [Austwickia chelonae NBRC 105200]|uniref:Uncharacterized protein n=2 Tax=Austwickia TaxID=1184606 RepID=K6V4P9_9MICO|nr:hypothetical protein AUCHE_05_00270 [Austwickia chelonae NBRC 105200]
MTESSGPVPMAQAITHATHQLNYEAGKPFDTFSFIKASARTYPDAFGADLINKASSFFGKKTSGRPDLYA